MPFPHNNNNNKNAGPKIRKERLSIFQKSYNITKEDGSEFIFQKYNRFKLSLNTLKSRKRKSSASNTR